MVVSSNRISRRGLPLLSLLLAGVLLLLSSCVGSTNTTNTSLAVTPTVVFRTTTSAGPTTSAAIMQARAIVVAPPGRMLVIGDLLDIRAGVLAENGTCYREITPELASLDPNVAVVRDGGVWGKAPGWTSIVVSYGGVSTEVTVGVFADEQAVADEMGGQAIEDPIFTNGLVTARASGTPDSEWGVEISNPTNRDIIIDFDDLYLLVNGSKLPWKGKIVESILIDSYTAWSPDWGDEILIDLRDPVTVPVGDAVLLSLRPQPDAAGSANAYLLYAPDVLPPVVVPLNPDQVWE